MKLYYTWLYIVHVSKPILQRGNLTHVMGVSAPILPEKKPYVPCVMGVGTPLLFPEAESFSYTPYIVGLATPMLF